MHSRRFSHPITDTAMLLLDKSSPLGRLSVTGSKMGETTSSNLVSGASASCVDWDQEGADRCNHAQKHKTSYLAYQPT